MMGKNMPKPKINIFLISLCWSDDLIFSMINIEIIKTITTGETIWPDSSAKESKIPMKNKFFGEMVLLE